MQRNQRNDLCVCVCLPACVLNRQLLFNRRVFPNSRLSIRNPKKSEKTRETREIRGLIYCMWEFGGLISWN
jgi:hypothetical protein